MTDISTTYMGLELRNPVIVGSSTHTITPEKVEKLAAAGAGAVVLKSLFEEQIRVDVSDMYGALEDAMHPEAYEYLSADLPMQLGPQTYLDRIEAIKAAVDIPVLASLNCISGTQWTSFARKVQAAGADAVEVNLYDIPDDPELSAEAVETRHLETFRTVKAELDIPVAVKLSPFYTALMDLALKLDQAGAAGLVLFNRFFQPDIDIDKLQISSAINLSRPDDIRLPLRWIALLRQHVSCGLCLTSGVHGAEGVVKAILAGADAVQICSVLYAGKSDLIGQMLDGLREWMARKSYASLSDFRGLLRQQEDRPQGYERAQYVKTLVGLE